ncbi:MAG TPA: protein-L-isoaspartate(D-aspartate) O-methyltransferase [Cyclobacteriaceae bacterium]|nr:protein-L-isoaspartate(D-aspartate) O-methyltransferase [Cyclobacteriaceae bacterium]HMV09981.1 protein-L-isoaspartate(D-aspartate) O-methyltransferase [Cyclobacteriaceae bacterium]HMV89819.1 protein-L-isoaspartate(D-aspartate) O-methyltransferase [Cyclobacteriaceae bacterium]HMX01580.1 protein-L-isoaspartate(D-aspartate) O-methyltransferase [Cyclobacteriaceae bacterium]HMX50726.1 protein-L-isoaspartate(D-aspartate) O-methyltransferase [Cyclobacteriaceae bacterium]
MLEDNYKQRGLRNKLVKTLEKKGISDPNVLKAIGKVPRHVFFETALLEHAYQDKAFPIGEGQTISQPYTVAFQTEKLEVKPGDKVLEIGTGSGYQACILLELGAKVYTIEYNKKLYDRTKVLLPRLGYNPYFFHGDGSKGLPAKAPYDKIIVTAGAPVIPKSLTDQLADNGILIIPVGNRDKQVMLRITRKKDQLITEEFENFAFVPLLGKEGWGS